MTHPSVQDLMTEGPVCCTPEDSLDAVARMMVERDCGAIPVVDSQQTHYLVGMITDRDIVCRVVAQGLNPAGYLVRDAMTPEPVSLRSDATVHECVLAMEQSQVRRIPIVDDRTKVIGIVTQADLAQASHQAPELESELAEMVEELSEPATVPAG